MSDLTIEWDRDRVLVAAGEASGTKTHFRLLENIPRNAGSDDVFELVSRLREIAGAFGGAGNVAARVILPRQLVTIHRIQLPNIAEAEIPDLLALQASMKLTVPVESVRMDFTPLPVAADAVSRDVLLTTVPRALVEQVRSSLADAGISLQSMRVGSYCSAQFLQNAGIPELSSATGGAAVIAVLRGDFSELIFAAQGGVVYSHSGAGVADGAAVTRVLRAELSRARLAAADLLTSFQFQRLILVGAREFIDAAAEDLGSRLGITQLVRIDPTDEFVSAVPAEISAGAVIALAGELGSAGRGRVAGVDLLNPRRAPEKRDLRRVKILSAVLAVVVMIAGGYFWRESKVSSLTAQKRLVDVENSETRATLDAGLDSLKNWEKIRRWTDRDIEWLDELSRLQSLMPGTERLLVDNFVLNVLSRDGVGSVRFEAWAKSESDINELARILRDSGYGIRPYSTDRSAAPADRDYGVRVKMEVLLPDPQNPDASVS